MSTTSALLTPTDLSPARSFDFKLQSPYETNPTLLSPSTYNSLPNIQHHNSMIDHSSSVKPFEYQMLSPPQSPPSHPVSQVRSLQQQSPYLPPPNPFFLYEPFSEQLPSTSVLRQSQSQFQQSPRSYYTAVPQTTRNMELRRVPSVLLSQPPLPVPSEWLRPDQKPAGVEFELGDGGIGAREAVLSSPPRFSNSRHSSPGSSLPSTPVASSHAHEVGSSRSFIIFRLCAYMRPRDLFH